ncbi:MAG: N-acetylmuramoyl-L-alanine amidase, partial [Bacteroidia bacterium]|nr:N-acetylmuramoyl-L-alanine amidase [Bacteroidia bacterium]
TLAVMTLATTALYAQESQTLKVTRGKRDVVNTQNHIILGIANPSDKVTVNGEPVHVYKTGSWGIEVQLQEGKNTIHIASVGDKSQEIKFDVIYDANATKTIDPKKLEQEKQQATFYPANLIVTTKPHSYLNYGAGADRLGGAKINYLPEGIDLTVEAENSKLYRVRLSQNRRAYIPKDMVEIKGRTTPAQDFMQNNVVLSSSFSVANTGNTDRVTVRLAEKKPFIVKEYSEPHKIILDLYGVQCNTNWITHYKNLKSIDNVDIEGLDTDVTRVTIYLKSKTSWGYSFKYEGSNLLLDIKHTPTNLSLKGMVIGIDAGHGGPRSSGAVSNTGIKEKDVNLKLTFILKEMLEKEGAKVVLSRTEDVAMSMRERQDFFINNNADIVLSIHNNADINPLSVSGSSTYYRYNVYRPLAETIQNNLLSIKGVQDFGITGNFNFSLCSITDYPCVLVETLFMSNLWDEEQLADPIMHKKLMEKVTIGLKEYINYCRKAEGIK